jgi:hypothetical protein
MLSRIAVAHLDAEAHQQTLIIPLPVKRAGMFEEAHVEGERAKALRDRHDNLGEYRSQSL